MLLLFLVLMPLIHTGPIQALPRSTLTVTPDSTVFTGETVSLKCVIEPHYSDWRYEWYKSNSYNTVTLQRSEHYTVNRDTLTIKKVITSDQDQYWCSGQRDGEPTSSQPSYAVSLIVKERPKPVVHVDPDENVFIGETVTLTCDIQGTQDWQYNWYKDRNQNDIVQHNQKYIITTVDGYHGGVYSCEGTQSKAPTYSQMSDGVQLTVSEKLQPTLTVKPQGPVFTGDTVTLSCDVGQSTAWTIHWRKDSNPEYTDAATKTIRSVSVSDEGTYRCRAKRGKYYSEFSTAEITVNERPKPVVHIDPDEHVFIGEMVTLTCDIQGTHDWQYNWYKGRNLNYIVGIVQKYIITTVDWSHSGEYRCGGTQSKAPTYSQMSDGVKMTVSGLPTSRLTVAPYNPVFTGETVDLKCVIESYSDWRYEWYKGSTNNPVSTEFHTVNRDTLTIRGATESDQDKYWCKGQRDKRPKSSLLSSVSLIVKALPTSGLTVTPDNPVFTGETVNLKCEIQSYIWRQRNGLTHAWTPEIWIYVWYKGTDSVMLQMSERYTVNRDTLTIKGVVTSDQGQYWCRGKRDERPKSSHLSSAVSFTVKDPKPKPELTSDPAGAALTGNTVTLTCHMDLSTGWDFYWYKHTLTSETKKTKKMNSYKVKIDSVSDGGQFWCRAGRGKPVYYTQYSDALWVNVTVSPKAVVTVRPDERVFRGETVTLRCDIKWGGDTEWTYRWEIEGTNYQHKNSVSRISTQEWNISSVKDIHSGKYTCTGQMGTQSSQRSDAVTLTVSAEAQAAVRVSPQPWLTEGDSVTLICEVTGSSTGWTFSWFRDDDHLSDSSRGAGGSYTLSPAALQHTGVYTCRAERGRPAFNTNNSSTQPLWITGVSPSVSLVVSPNRSQHFSSDSLSLSCEDQSNSAGWTVRRYTDRNTEDCSKQTGSTCRIVSLSTSDTGVYWCQSESGEKRHPLNITVHDGDVILVSSVDPVIEGDTLTLHCLHRSTNSPILRADFYKDGSLVQNQTTGEMSITTVSKSYEGFYYCKTERGQSLHSWISVRACSSSPLLVTAVVVGLSVCLLFFISLVLLWRYKKNKDQQHNINQTSVSNQSGGFQMENSPLQSDSDHIYDDVTEVNKKDRDPESFPEVTYSEITVKKKISVDKDDTTAGSNDVTYSELRTKVKKCKSKGADAGVDATYAQPIRKKGP
ncbi:hypothetical protein QQF64_031010 [Cirrhinus molitorella]|uniref:Ig-like domain-containing protein n=1 Tax=Cirrhinus molitorella TaxID=172907 RepID=A0ABR3N4Y2_9TELE